MEAGERGEGEVAPDSVRAYGHPPDTSPESGREAWLGAMRCRERARGMGNKTYTGRSAETHHLERGDGSTGRRRRIEEKTASNRAPPRIASASPEIEERERAKHCERFGRKNKGEMARFPKFKRHSLTGGAHHPTRYPDMRC
jgi:hypothetical protein